MDAALAMGALVGFLALWLVAVATDDGHGCATYAVWAVALLVAVVAVVLSFFWGFAPDALSAPF